MKCKAILVLSIAICAATCFGDHMYTSAKWNGWEVTTGEELWLHHRHTSYPIWQMFDGDPKTAWVYSGGFGDWRAELDGPQPGKGPTWVPPLRDRYWIELTPGKATRIDEIRIMNGYNKDAKTFSRNARITEVEVFATTAAGPNSSHKTKIGTYSISDSMGWHSIKFQVRPFESLRLEVTAINHGVDPDVAISELKLLCGGKDAGPGKPEYVVFNRGDECGCGGQSELIAANGAVLATGASELEGITKSPVGPYYLGGAYRERDQTVQFWVFDAKTRKRVWAKRYRDPNYPILGFGENGSLRVTATSSSKVPIDKVMWASPTSQKR